MSESRNLAAVRASYESSARGDIPGILAPLTEESTWTEMAGFPYGGTYRGPDEVLEKVFDRLGSEWEGYQAEPDHYVDGGETIVVTGHYSGTYRATGRAMRVRFTHVWRMRDGHARSFEQFTDTLLVHRAIHPGTT